MATSSLGTDAVLDRVGIARAINRADRGGQTFSGKVFSMAQYSR